MDEEVLIENIGDYKVHDSRIKEICYDGETVKVKLIAYEGEELTFNFNGVKSIRAVNPVDMILYSVAEMKEESPHRKFIFVNWDEEKVETLEVVAEGYNYKATGKEE